MSKQEASKDSQNPNEKNPSIEDSSSSPQPATPNQTLTLTALNSRYLAKLTFLFGLVYFSQGFTGTQGVISQPFAFYFKQGLKLEADVVSSYLAILAIPWLIKPIYGLISDYFPFLGYRRKSWLIMVNFAACMGFFTVSGAQHPVFIIMALTVTSIGVAASDVIIDAITVEKGRRHNCIGRFQSVQWLWLNVALLISSLIGGYLCTEFKPGHALHTAALLAMITPAMVVVASWMIINENRFAINFKQTRITTTQLVETVKSKTLWFIALYISFWAFSPAFGLPLYYHMTDNLHFNQTFIGQLAAIQSGGAIIGAIVHNRFVTKYALRTQLIIAIIIGTLAHLTYLFICIPSQHSQNLAIGISLVVGIADIIGSLAIYNLAARACARRVEGFTFAILMSLYNGAYQLGVVTGGWLFVNSFSNSITPLIFVSSLFTFLCIALVPILNSQIGSRMDTDD